MASDHRFPRFRQVVLDTTDVRRLADFYRDLLGFAHREGDETPQPDEEWLIIVDPVKGRRIAFLNTLLDMCPGDLKG